MADEERLWLRRRFRSSRPVTQRREPGLVIPALTAASVCHGSFRQLRLLCASTSKRPQKRSLPRHLPGQRGDERDKAGGARLTGG